MTSPYTPSQLSAYLSQIGLPKKYWPSSNPTRNLQMLTALHTHAISTHPYENLSLHYTPSISVSLNPQDIYRKFMSNGRGGYCFEHGIFFNHILRAMGFSAHMAGVRIRMRVEGVPVGDYSGWFVLLSQKHHPPTIWLMVIFRRHVVNIITLPSGQQYITDVGFGGDGPIKPLPLINNHITTNIGSQQLRLIHSHIPSQTLLDGENKMWIYQYRNSPTVPWNSFYAFPSTLEFFAADLEILSYFISHSPESFQTYRLLVVKFLRTEPEGGEEDAKIHAKIMLVGDLVKLNTGGRTSVIQTCRTEEERVEALKKHFGIELSEEERLGIRGRVTELGRLASNDTSASMEVSV